jgi:flagellar hook protein FlgE
MGLLSSLFAGVSGLNSSGSSISIIGDNIANTNTIGYKASRAQFVDVLSGSLAGSGGGSQIGAGSRLEGVEQNFTQGSLESTSVTTDLAIDGGGFFIVQDTDGVFYSRNGQFQLNANQILVNAQGQSVQGFGITTSGVPNGALGNIDLSSVSSTPAATDLVEVNVNVDPNDPALPGGSGAFSAVDPVGTSNFQTGVRIYDSLGNPRNILIYFRRNDAVANSWFYYAGVARGELDLSTAGAPFSGFAAGPASQFFPMQSGTLTFNTAGALQAVSTAALSIQYDTDGDGALDGAATATPQSWPWNNGAAATTSLTFDFGTPIAAGGTGTDMTTQYGGSSASGVNSFVRFMNQDGYSAGSLQNLSIDESGFVTGNFSNGQSVQLAQVALANFPNVNGLSRVGDNNWLETNDSGQPIIGSPNQASFGAIRSGFLELSNTDLAEEFVKLIISQRAFQANTRTITTTNELLANLVVLGA